jgi:hypothetical protein
MTRFLGIDRSLFGFEMRWDAALSAATGGSAETAATAARTLLIGVAGVERAVNWCQSRLS